MSAESNPGAAAQRASLAIALTYVTRGWSVVPIPPRSKAPRANGWQKMRLRPVDLPNHFTARSNIGVLLGEPSNGLVDVDLDHPLAVELADEFLPPRGSEFGRKNKPRSHRLYRPTRPVETRKWKTPDDMMIVERRSTGTQTVFPGSVHPSGEPVQWHVDGEPAAVDPDQLHTALEALAAEVLRRLGGPTKHVTTGEASAANTVGRSDVLDCARKYLAKIPPAVSGQGGHSATFHAACLLVLGFGLEREQALNLLTEWNQTCQPPWSEKELAHKVDDAFRQPGDRGYLLVQSRTKSLTTKPSTKPKRRAAPLEPYKPFPVGTLPEPVRSFVAEASTAVGCDSSFVALPLLAALAATIGNKRRIKLKSGRTGWCEPSVVWCVTVGESGTLKSPALDHALAPLRHRQTKALREYREALKEYERHVLTYDADLADWKKSGRKKGDPPPTAPEEPRAERFLVSNITLEALIDRLNDNPNGLLMECDELAGWIGSFNQYKGGKGGDVPQWLSMHRAGQVLSDRKTGKKILFAERGAVSVCGGIQPEILRMALAREHFEDGLGARLLLAMPPTTAKSWTNATVDDRTEEAIETIFARLLALEPAADSEGNDIPYDLPLSPAAKAAWIDWYNSHAREQAELTGDLAAAWSKLEGYAARLALVVHLVRVAADDPTIESPDKVDEASIRAGCILSDWFGQEARRVYGVLGESDEDHEDRQLVELIQRKGGRITARELMHASRQFRGSSEAAEAALEALVKAGRGKWEVDQDQAGGRPTRSFVLCGAGDGDTTGHQPEETEVLSPSPPNDEDNRTWTF